MSTLNTTFAGLRLSSPVIVGSCSLTANIDKLKERYPDKFDPELSKNRKDGDI